MRTNVILGCCGSRRKLGMWNFFQEWNKTEEMANSYWSCVSIVVMIGLGCMNNTDSAADVCTCNAYA